MVGSHVGWRANYLRTTKLGLKYILFGYLRDPSRIKGPAREYSV